MIAFAGRPGSSDDWENDLDFSSIEFPSDKLTIKTLRQIHPKLFDHGVGGSHSYELDIDLDQPKFFYQSGSTELDQLAEMLHHERVIAAYAYAKAAGRDLDLGLMTEESAKHWVAKAYAFFHVSSGPHQTQELIRGIEEQARNLAQSRQL